MDLQFSGSSDSIDVFNFDDGTMLHGYDGTGTILPSFDPSTNMSNGYKFNETLDLSFLEPSYPPPQPYSEPGHLSLSTENSSELDSPDEFADTVLKFLNQILVEENMEGKPSMFHDPLALQATEKSLYDALGEKYPSSPVQPPIYDSSNTGSPDDYLVGCTSEGNASSSTSASHSTDPQCLGDTIESKPSVFEHRPSEFDSIGSFNSFNNDINVQLDPFTTTHLVQSMFSNSESILQFNRGMEEASKFLPPTTSLVIDLDKYDLPTNMTDVPGDVVVKVENNEKESSPNGSKGRKHYQLDDSLEEEERRSKQSATCVDESQEAELSEMFDRVLLCPDDNHNCYKGKPIYVDSNQQQNGQANGGKPPARKPLTSMEAVDLRTLLVSCAQSVAADDRRTAYEQLKQIRQYSCPTGDASQRVASIFAGGLEARLAGTGSQLYAAQCSKRISAVEKLKAYQVFLSACPFKKIAIIFAGKMILDAAAAASTLHIVDFGIQYGFQWPMVIKHLSTRAGGPPKLRITAIELPQPGFRPAEMLEETGRRLAKYCERFKVQFEYNAIASQNWETIKIEDLKIERDEYLAVNCLLRFKNLLDETVDESSPRDAVLKLVRRMKPDIFVHSVINGSYSAPFFVTRFREALFHFSTLFDIFDDTLERDNEQRLNFEREFYGREAMNVIACEGAERVERPETYKQWHSRNIRAGFKPLPLYPHLFQKLESKVRAGYHKDFVFDKDGSWLLQGYKGRVLTASSCWVPA